MASKDDSNVPAWARGLDMSESRKLAEQLNAGAKGLVERKERTAESDRRARLPAVVLRPHYGPDRRTNIPRSVSIEVAAGGIAGSHVWGVVDALRADGFRPASIGVRTIRENVGPKDDPKTVADVMANALRERGYRVTVKD